MDYLKVIVISVLLFPLFDHSEAGGNCTAVKKCDDCLKYNESTCYWCESTDECIEKHGLPPKGCTLHWKYGNCIVPGYVWLIVVPVLSFLFLVSLACCFYCFCCRCKTSSKSLDKEETKFHRKRIELKAKHDERRAERNLKNDEIRKKYGLFNEDGATSSNKYEEFENDPEA